MHLILQSIIKKEVHTLFDALYIGVHIVDKDGITILYNEKCEEIEGLTRDFVLGSDIKDLVKRGVYSESVSMEAINSKSLVAKTQQVNQRNIFSTSVPILDQGEFVAVVTNVMDISNITSLEFQLKELEKVNETITEELGIIQDLNQTNELKVSRNKMMNSIFRLALRVSKADSTVFILGESGVGKEFMARFIHANSDRKERPFFFFDCSAYPRHMIHPLLFGTSDEEMTPGIFRQAQGGCVYISEISNLPLESQRDLMSIITEKVIPGDRRRASREIDVRVIASSSEKLLPHVQNGNFREDLYFRLQTVPIEIPPLRDRRNEIMPFISHFLDLYNKKYNKNKTLSVEAIQDLIHYSWPENLRELEEEIERGVVFSQSNQIMANVILLAATPQGVHADTTKDLRENVLQFERELMKMYLAEARDIHHLSELTGLEVSSLRKKAKRIDVDMVYDGS